MKIKPFTFGTQNVTEGRLTSAILTTSASVLQEIDPKKVKQDCRKEGRCWFIPRRDEHQAVIWDPQWLQVTSAGWTRFHMSGRAENLPFATPSRGVVWVRGKLVENPEVRVALFGIWFLNSWMPIRTDAYTRIRRHVVEDISLPILRKKVQKWRKDGRVVIGGGDANSISWPGHLPGMDQPWQGGLDRVWYDYRELNLKTKREGPVTGVGTDMRHASRIARLAGV